MKALFKVAVPLFALVGLVGCGDNLDPSDQDTGSIEAGDEGAPEGEPAPGVTLSASFTYEPADCHDSSYSYTARVFYSDDSSTDNVACQFHFADGSTADGCFVTRSTPATELVRLTVNDAVTGATAEYEENVAGAPGPTEIPFDAGAGDGFIAWGATVPDGWRTIVDVDPINQVIIPDPNIFGDPFGVLQVTSPGVYTITLVAFPLFPGTIGCSATMTKSVEVLPVTSDCDDNGDGDTTDHGECDHVCHEGE